jgi:hypothetical protein
MLKNKNIWILAAFVNCMICCRTAEDIPVAYQFKMKETDHNPYGCWIIANVREAKQTSSMFAGELLCFSEDSVYLLTADFSVNQYNRNSIISATICTHKNMSGHYAWMSTIFFIPNVLGVAVHNIPAFLALGIPTAVAGLIVAVNESSSGRNILHIPGDLPMNQLGKYARFPAGKPEGINLRSLTLKIGQ